MSINDKVKKKIDKLSEKNYLINYKGDREAKAVDFSLDITPTYSSIPHEDGGNVNVGTYVLTRNHDNLVASKGYYHHSILKFLQRKDGSHPIFDFFERLNIKRAIKKDMGYKLNHNLVSDIVDLHYLLKEEEFSEEQTKENKENSLDVIVEET